MNSLYLKHRLATGPLAGTVDFVRRKLATFQILRHPELGLVYEEDQMMHRLMGTLIGTNYNCVDVGAHIGSVSYLLQKLAPKGSLTIIEALPAKARWLRSRFPDCDVYQTAVSDFEGEVCFYENLDQPGFSSLSNRSSYGQTREIRVRCRRLDDLVPPDRPIHFMKIDVEGHELSVLRGARRLISVWSPVILFEAGSIHDESPDHDRPEDLFHFMTEEMGYQIFAVFDLFFQRPAIDAIQFRDYRTYPFRAFNYFAVPAGSEAPGLGSPNLSVS